MVINCRALKDCISCLSQVTFQCIWQADEDPNNRYPCRNGYSDVEMSSPVAFFRNVTECTRILNAPVAHDGFIRVPAEQYERDHHGRSQWVHEVNAIITGVVSSAILVGSVLYILNRRFKFFRRSRSATTSRQTESLELLPRESQNQNSDTESEYGHAETMRDLESVLRASSAGIGCSSSNVWAKKYS